GRGTQDRSGVASVPVGHWHRGGGCGGPRAGSVLDADQGVADADLVAEGDAALVHPLAVDPGALDAAHVDDRQLPVGGHLDHRVDAADLVVVETEVGGGEPTDLDDVPVVVSPGDHRVALEDLESERYGHCGFV